jgi:2-polyprenyl-3-methyl-5-hydroxy-6-metoxy-1,4-benzoquinol methylase
MTDYSVEANESATMTAVGPGASLRLDLTHKLVTLKTCSAHAWDSDVEPNPRFQKCVNCGAERWRVDCLNSGDTGRTYWNLMWGTLGARVNTYPDLYWLIMEMIPVGDSTYGENPRVIDVGCGSGAFLELLWKERGCTVNLYGIDISEKAIELCKQRVPSLHGFVFDFPTFDDDLEASFDSVVCTEFLEHAKDDDAAAAGLAKLCTKYGRVFVSVPDNELPPEQEREHMRVYTEESLGALLRKHFKRIVIVKLTVLQKLLAVCAEPKPNGV